MEALKVPSSAAALARTLGLPRQKLGYHLRALEAAGLVRLAEERRSRGFTERLLVAANYLVDPDLLASPGTTDLAAVKNGTRHPGDHLINTASRVVRDVARMRQAADSQGAHLLTVTVEGTVAFASPEALEQFTRELTALSDDLTRRYDSPNGRRYRLVAALHPASSED
ncbi:helix-turn-helix domain-containing protein [soil metagenome]